MSMVKSGGASSNPFYTPEDGEVDDDAFLNHPRAGTSGYMLPQHNQSSVSPLTAAEERQRQLLIKKKEIEERTLDSSHRSLGLLYESEKVGVATAEELNRQKDQLLQTEGRLDEINTTLKTSERHLQGIKSVFGGIKNYLFARNSGQQGGGALADKSQIMMPQSNSESAIATQNFPSQSRLDSMRSDAHPGLRTRGLMEEQQMGAAGPSVDDILDRNLDEMSSGLSRLKGLAQGLNKELDDHNDIIDRLDHKTSNAGWRVEKQNKDMSKLLKKWTNYFVRYTY